MECKCGSEKSKSWHLVCNTCWEKIPQEIRDELYAAYTEAQGTERHKSAVHAALTALESA